MDRSRPARWPGAILVVLLLVVALGLVAAGCGGSDDSTGGSETAASTEAEGGSASSGVEAAKEAIAQYEQPPTSIGITEPLQAKPEAGKKIAIVACNLPTCKLFFEAGKEAGEALGWTTTSIVTTGEPEDLNAKVSQAVSEKPDGILVTGFSRETFEEALGKAEAAEIPVVTSGVPDETEPPYIAVTTGTPLFERNGEILGNWIVADSNGEANVAIYNVPIFPILVSLSTQIQKTVEAGCECSVKIVDQQLANIGTNLPKNAVSTLQTDPDINYLVFPDGNFAAGVTAAVRDAGLADQVKIVGVNASPTNLAEIMNGEEDAYMAYSIDWTSWAGFDSFARFFAGEEAQNDPLAAPTEILTKANVKSDQLWSPPNYQEEFKKLWKVG